MKSKKIILVSLSLLFVGLCVVLVQHLTIKKTNLSQPKTLIEAVDLSMLFLEDEEKATLTYANTIVKVSGIVKKISFLNNVNTVILFGKNSGTSIICEMNANVAQNELPKKNEVVQLKGICKGFLKDVVLLNCQLTNK